MILVFFLVEVPRASAHDMDLAIARLSRGACERTLVESDDFALRDQGEPVLRPDNDAFARLTSQLSAAVAPGLLAPVTTRGPAGFDIAFDTNITRIDANAGYWRRGTRGGSGPATCDGINNDVASALTASRVRFTKGLPLGLSVGASLGTLHRTSLWTAGAELKLALVEGLEHALAPSVAVRLATNRLVGDGTVGLSTLSADVLVSKEWVAMRTLKVAPYAALGSLWTHARTELVDLTPNVDALACAAGTDTVCNAAGLGASDDDLAHDRAFARQSLLRYRAFVGVWLRYGVAALAAEATFDLISPAHADRSLRDGTRQWGINIAPSLSF